MKYRLRRAKFKRSSRRENMPAAVSIHHDDHMIGSRDAAIVLVEYGDYQCPYCRRAHAAV